MQFALRSMAAFALTLLLSLAAAAQNANILQPVGELEAVLIAEPMAIASAQISRPTAKGDITLRAEVSFGGAPPMRVKLRRAEPGAETFNNVPRYELAAYELQKLFLDPIDYVVPPTALRMVPLAEVQKYAPAARNTFSVADQVLCVLQYWLNDIKGVADVLDRERFDTDPLYARHIGQLNILTYLIQHRDSNLGNFLIGRDESGARVFSVDHGVAFASDDSDRGDLWKNIRVTSLPADAVERLRQLTLPMLEESLGVVAQWRLEQRRYLPVAKGPNLAASRGVRRRPDTLQMGLTTGEIRQLHRLLRRLLEQVDEGKIKLMPPPAA